ncbi:hypothetical protein J5226_19260 [Lysobacter sp. K5869]|uniref:hypothetical protein n=1 Tax=Lysobacter sp. K5869 TaxID=2820808 RepID=UPI001C061768|nr:hypothetical protein [Lysobacter sp. K5869]QWP75726.1 hypothetical protein J5226_19260 [Lysobacter sp. K5869]
MPAPLSPAELAWYVTGRFYVSAQDQHVADYGYFLHLGGVAGELFDGRVHESRAHFTFAAQPFLPRTAHNGALGLSLDPAGEFSVYLQREPAGDFDRPESFAQGECIATFQRVGLVVDTTVAAQAGGTTAKVLTDNVFSARLMQSRAFEFAGGRYDLAAILGRGVTQFGTAAAVPVAAHPPAYSLVFPFTGSALALGA